MAKRQEILLTQDVLKLGNMGDIVRVAPGYARNYILPYQLGIPAGHAAKRQIEVLREKAAKSEVEREGRANILRKTMEGMSIQIAARVAHENELFGSIGTREIVAALAKSGVEVDSKQVHLNDKIKKLGKYTVEVRLHKKVGVNVTVEIVNSDPDAPALDEALAGTAAPAAEGETAAAPAAAAPKKVEVKIKNLGKGDAAKPAAEAEAPKKSKGKADAAEATPKKK